MAGYTSRAFAVERALFQLLLDQTWPDGPGGDTPLVNLGGMANPPDEVIFLGGVPADAPSQETATNRSKDETFTLRVVIETWVPGRTALEVSERLEELADVVQSALRTAGGGLTNTFNGADPTHPVPGVISWAVTATRPRHFTMVEGAVGACDVDIEFRTRL